MRAPNWGVQNFLDNVLFKSRIERASLSCQADLISLKNNADFSLCVGQRLWNSTENLTYANLREIPSKRNLICAKIENFKMEAFTYISTKIYPASAEVLPSYRHADKTFKNIWAHTHFHPSRHICYHLMSAIRNWLTQKQSAIMLIRRFRKLQ